MERFTPRTERIEGPGKMDIKKKVIAGIIWKFLECCGAQGVTFIVSIILARLLDPEDYSTIAIVTVFLVFFKTFIDSGLGVSLIQKKDADSCDFSSVFYFNLTIGVIVYTLIFFLAPWIARLYNKQELVSIVRVLGLTLIVFGVKNIQEAYVSKKMLFKKFFFSTLAGTVGAGILGCWMAFNGYGVWALIAQNMFNICLDTIILWITVEWRPTLEFSVKRLKGLLDFGWKLLVTSLIDSLYDNFRQLLIGKRYQLADLAYYNKGSSVPETIILNINSALESVFFPAFSVEQSDAVRIKSMLRRAIQICSFIILPMSFGLMACAETLVCVLFTDKWIPCVPYLKLYCIVFATYPINTINLDVIKGLGRSDIFFKQWTIKKVLYICVLLATLWISPLAIAVGYTATTLACMIVNAYPNRKLVNYSFAEQFLDILPSIVSAVVMTLGVSFAAQLQMNFYAKLVVQIIIGVIIYAVFSFILNRKLIQYLFLQLINRHNE